MQAITAKRIVIAVLCLLLPLALLALPRSRRRPVQQTATAPPTVPSVTKPLAGSRNPWTLAEARAALKRHPDDGYLQFVVLQLARQEGRLAEVRHDIPLFGSHDRSADTFGVFTNTNAAQQRLQADVMLADQPNTSAANPSPSATALEELHGPLVGNRPWKQMLGGKSPAVSPLSRFVPADFYLAEFRALDRLAAALDSGRSWVGFVKVQAAQDATDRQVRRRLEQQLVFDVEDRALAPLAERVVVTGSDPFLGEGTDVTVLVQLRPDAVEAFRNRTERALSAAAAQPGAGRTPGKYLDIDYVYVASADRRINAYAVTLARERLHIRSNSRPALYRVLAAIRGKSPALGDTDELRVVRAHMPLGANEEDGLVYLPEAFVRRLVGPALQITEARRLIGYNHLRMIANAAELYRTQFGTAPASLEELTRTGCAPGTFNEGALASPFGGTYALGPDGISGTCSVLGTADNLTPCIELAVSSATPAEAEGYRQFARKAGGLGQLWLTPVALRMQTGGRTVRAEALMLASPDTPARAELARLLGERPEALEPLPTARRSIASIGLRLNKQRWIAEHLSGMPPRRRATVAQLGMALAAAIPVPLPARVPWGALVAPDLGHAAHVPLARLEAIGIEPAQLRTLLQRGIGDQAALHLCDSTVLFDVSLPTLAANLFGAAQHGNLDTVGLLYGMGAVAGTMASPAYVAVPVKDSQVVDAFLARLDESLGRDVPTWRGRMFGTQLQGEFYHLATPAGPPTRSLGVRAGAVRYRVFWTRIGDGLYIANQPSILDELRTAARERSPLAGSDRGPVAHAMLKLRPAHAVLALPGMRLGWEEANREACQRNLGMLSAAARAFSFTPPVTRIALDQETQQRLVMQYAGELYGCDFACPDGGHYLLADDGRSFSCSVHGSSSQPRQPERPLVPGAERLAEATATLTLMPDGLRVVVTLTQR